MEVGNFVLSVWASILLGIFFIAMIIGCTFDRHGRESGKWWVFVIGLAVFLVWGWNNHGDLFSWQGFKTFIGNVAGVIGIYLAIGLGYSMIEFMLEVRRSAKKWAIRWAEYKRNTNEKNLEVVANSFVAKNSNTNQLITAERNPDEKSPNLIVPRVSRGSLASYIGAWTFFWPFYAVSLIIGDLLSHIFSLIADFITHMSGRFVRVMFKDVFN